ncbi:MAG: hypothetical protein ACHQZR_07550 [Candidatus Limnocylindrales bacterium]
MTYLVRLGRFLYDFLVGDAWELFLGPLLALAAAWVLLQMGLSALAGATLVTIVLAVIAVHLTVALRQAS